MSEPITIGKKIASVAVLQPGLTRPVVIELEHLNEQLARPEALQGRTYKIKTPVMEHALYLTINDIVLNEGTEHSVRRPFEIFINSKEMESYQWIVALTRLVSAVFRKGGDSLFMVEELKSVFDPNGGYFSSKRQGRVPSLVAEIGLTIEEHFKWLGLIAAPAPIDSSIKAHIEEVKEQFVAAGGDLANATECKACGEIAVIRLDNCPTCTSCGDSKCG